MLTIQFKEKFVQEGNVFSMLLLTNLHLPFYNFGSSMLYFLLLFDNVHLIFVVYLYSFLKLTAVHILKNSNKNALL